ncbi:MAG: periplasmic heavy metal sensor [Deltaproteobacteria bacterium]
MKKKVFVALFVVAAFAGLSYVSAKACDKKDKSCYAGLPLNLKLSKEQKAKIEDIQDECKKSRVKTMADIKAIRIDLNALLRKDSIDKAAVDAKVDEIADQVKKAMKTNMDCKVKTLSLLDAGQKDVYLESNDDYGDGEHHYGGEKSGKMGCEKKDKKPCDMKGMGSDDKK